MRPVSPIETASVCVMQLATPPIACIVPPDVFDAFGWCASGTLEWRKPAGPRWMWDDETRIDGSDPARMVFVLRPGAAPFLPHELARLHAFGLSLEDESALAPWAIDDATDGLYEHRVRPSDAFWVAADNMNALFWALHDWSHFHNHGPFEQRAYSELQCDAAALAWLWKNRERLPIDAATWERVRQDVVALSAGRFAKEGLAFDASELSAGRVQSLLGDCARTTRS